MKILPKNEQLVRYLFNDRHFSRPKVNGVTVLKIKKHAVVPMQTPEGEWETSVMKTTGCSEPEIDQIGNDHVAKLRGEELVAYVGFLSDVVIDQDLKIDHDKYEHENHCSIKGWSGSWDDMLEQASDLADAITEHPSKFFKEF